MPPTAPSVPAPSGSSSAAPHGQPVGRQLADNAAIGGAIRTIVEQIRSASSQLTDARPAREGLRASYEQYMARAADVRGRGLLYPYIGSGVGNGALVELLDGSVKWDMICGIGVHFFGHSDPGMIQAALVGSLSDTVQHGNLQTNFEAVEFAETLLAEAKKGSRLRYCFPTTSGAMANENALKVCYQKTGAAPRVIAFKDCFMGRTVTMSQIGDTAAYRVGVPLTTLVDYMPFYDEVAARQMGGAGRYTDWAVKQLRTLIERYPKQHACFIFELVQGEGGFNTAPREFFKALMEVCRDAKIPVWDDEIQSFGRMERMFAYETLDLGEYVDVFCVGKMTQVCATLYTEEMNPGPGLLSGTFTGSTVQFTTGTHAVRRLRDGGYYGPDGVIARHRAAFDQGVRRLAAKHPGWFPPSPEVPDVVGGAGGMMRFTPFGGNKDRITKACKHLFDAGVIAFYCGHGPYHVRMLPPLGVMKLEDWPRVFECVERGLAKTAAEG